jgi:hypothetical protein
MMAYIYCLIEYERISFGYFLFLI